MTTKTPTVEELQQDISRITSERDKREAALKKERDDQHLELVRAREELSAFKSEGGAGDGTGTSADAAKRAADLKTREAAIAQREQEQALVATATEEGVEPAKLQEAIEALPADTRTPSMIKQVASNLALAAKVTALEAKGGEGGEGAGDGKPPPPRGASPNAGDQSPRTFDKGAAGMAQRLEAEKDNPKYKGILGG